jgi:hypothetical protein
MRCFLVSKRRVVPSRLVCFAASVLATVASLAAPGHAGVITFGSGSNQFNMEFVTIGNPGNLADTTGSPNPAGAVGYTYAIGKFEVSEDMIEKFNASQSLQITKDTRGLNKPATRISWNEAARFVNWLNTSTGGFAAYNFTTGGVNDNIALWTASDTLDYDTLNPYRSKRATYVLPSYDEWYKAAYYNPNDSTWYDYANGSDTAPTAVTGGTDPNTAVYTQSGEASPTGPADVTNAGGFSPYGVMGLNGNARDWQESSFDLTNSSGSLSRLFAAATGAATPAPCRRRLAPATCLPSRTTDTVFVSQVFLHPRRGLSRLRRRSSDSLHLAWLTALDATAGTRRS